MNSVKVSVTKHCHCVIRHEFHKDFFFENKEEAIKKAEEIIKILEEKCCNTHSFTLQDENTEDIKIFSKLKLKTW